MVDDVMAEPATRRAPVDRPAAVDPPGSVDRPAAVDAVRLAAPGPWWWPILAAVAAGLLLLTAFPPIDVWPAAPLGVMLLALATYRRGFWVGTGLGLLAGLALLIPLLSWAGGYVGAVWLFLPVGESFFFALLGGLSALVSPVLDRWQWGWPWVTGSLWVLQEAVRDRAPFGGFPWGRLAFSQADSPLLRLAAIGGAPLVTFGVAALGGLLALVATALLRRGTRPHAGAVPARDEPSRPRWRDDRLGLALTVAPFVLAIVAGGLAPPSVVRAGAATTGGDRQVRVAIVQGNVPRLGLEFNSQRRAVLDNHVDATLQLASRVAAGTQPRPDLVIWPENASDIDPLRNADARARIDEAARAIGAPILVGGLLDGPGPDDIRNVGIVWDPASGPGQTYVKRHPVPFAEYMPIRSFARLITDKVDLVRSDFVAGPTPGVLPIGPAVAGDVICFEVAYDGVVRDTVTGGAQLLVVQTNNATFTEAEARQQLAMVRLRAVEHGRAALMASTVGVSAFVDGTGKVSDATQFNAEAVITREVPLGTARTMATRLGILPELMLVGVAGGALAMVVGVRRRRSPLWTRRRVDG